MKKIILLLTILGLFSPVCAKDFSAQNTYQAINISKTLQKDLNFAEMQVFKKIYPRDDTEERIERLELALYGAIQSGEEKSRIKKLKKDTTNVTSGGSGLQYTTKAAEGFGNAMRNFALGYGSYGTGNYGGGNYRPYNYRNYFPDRYNPPCHCSHRLPPPPCNRSAIMPPPDYQYYNGNPRHTNGDFSRNYSLGTSVKILDD